MHYVAWSLVTEDAQRIVEQAANWAALFDSGEATVADRAACDAWCDADPGHRAVLERMWRADRRMAAAGGLEKRALHHLLDGERRRRGKAPGAILALVILAVAGWTSWTSNVVQDHFPDYRTLRGDIRTVALADGSRLTVDTDSAVRVREDRHRRTIRLLGGRLLAEVAPDRQRPFVVETKDGTATALGTAFTVAREAHGTVVAVSRSHVRACAGDAAPCRDLGPGERVRLVDGRIEPMASVPPEAVAGWTSGWLEVDDQDITDVLTQLNRYRQTPIGFDAADLRGIRVTGSFPLTDAARALDGIARSPDVVLVRPEDGPPRLTRRR